MENKGKQYQSDCDDGPCRAISVIGILLALTTGIFMGYRDGKKYSIDYKREIQELRSYIASENVINLKKVDLDKKDSLETIARFGGRDYLLKQEGDKIILRPYELEIKINLWE